MTKKEAVQLCKRGVEIILNAGFTVLPVSKWYQYSKQNRAGQIEITLRYEKHYKRRGYYVAVFGMFDDPKKAVSLGIDCNPFSGKHNFLSIEDVIDMQYCINQYQ